MRALERVLPAYGWLRTYRWRDLSGDLFAGLTLAVMLVPQGMAYALLAGLPPIMGLYAGTVPVIAGLPPVHQPATSFISMALASSALA